ncbi:MAG: N,N-dimethylformamidase beta subunit family domain-containing protein [Pseudomonadota bacterium]
MLPLAAYADRLSVRPGETIRFHAANATGQPVRARFVRVICADANPAGPGVSLRTLGSQPHCVSEPVSQHVPRGSYGVVPEVGHYIADGSFSVSVRVFPTLRSERAQTLLSVGGEAGAPGWCLRLTPNGALQLAGTDFELPGTRALPLRAWSVVWFSYDADGQTLTLGNRALPNTLAGAKPADVATCAAPLPKCLSNPRAPLMLAACDAATPGEHFNGKLELPALWRRTLSDEDIAALLSEDRDKAFHDVFACWNLGIRVYSNDLFDVGSQGLNGFLVNSPARAMTGSVWRGQEMNFVNARQEYGAIHFHEDDIDDCCWPVAYEWQVPDDTRSGVYALMLEAGDAQENVPFHIVPPQGESHARLAVLASTFTYTIYGNHARPEYDTDTGWKADWHAQTKAWGCYPHNPGDHKEYGLSTYNHHPDGSGISIASWHRPMLNVRVGYLTYCREAIRGSGLRHFPADSHLLAWLEDRGIDYDVITDWELHHEGASLLRRYQAVLTGSHPEYHTRPMLDALQTYRDSGGRLAYLGGNGFYWKIATSPNKDGVIEIRRGEGGIRAWAAEPGEYYNQFDGEYGGLWRRNGRPPQHLVGVGFTAQGNFQGSYYRRCAAAANPRVSWIFEGIDADILGDHGLSAHGAAGFELDRTDKRLGTPEHALVVASSENHPPDAPWVLVPEEMLTHITTWPGEKPEQLIRADMTFFETPAGGAMFSTGSITFCGSLLTNGCENDISVLVGNVVKRFLDPEPFQMPVD